MRSVEFPLANRVYSLEGCSDLHARLFIADKYANPTDAEGVPCIETRWLPNEAERAAILAGGAIVLKVVGVRPQPVCLRVIKDDKEVHDD